MKRWIALVACAGSLALTSCRTDDATATGTPAGGRSPATDRTTSAPAPPGSPDLRCLLAGSPWTVSKRDLESQIQGAMRGIDVTSVHIDGDQTLAVTPDLQATFTDNTTTTITVNLSHGLTMVMKQQHDGSAAGRWTANGNALTPSGAWTGRITGTNHVEINGRAGNAPFQAPENLLGAVAMTYTCADGVLELTVEGSPFVYMFR